jgi:hypothetical protein
MIRTAGVNVAKGSVSSKPIEGLVTAAEFRDGDPKPLPLIVFGNTVTSLQTPIPGRKSSKLSVRDGRSSATYYNH